MFLNLQPCKAVANKKDRVSLNITLCQQYIYKLDRKIIAVINTTYAVVKRKPEKNQACTGFEPYDLCDTGAALYQLR